MPVATTPRPGRSSSSSPAHYGRPSSTQSIGWSRPGSSPDAKRVALRSRLPRPSRLGATAVHAAPSPSKRGRVELAAGGDAELGVGLVQVVADRPGAEEELSGDVAVGQPLGGQPGNLQLLRSQGGQPGPGWRWGADAGGAQLDARQLGPRGGVAAVQTLHGGAELAAGVGLAAGATQPRAVQQLGAGLLEGFLVELERGEVVLLGVIVGDQRSAAFDQRVGAG